MPAGDNITAPIPSGSTESLAFDEFADGSKAGVCRLDIGSGSTEGRVTAANPLPVTPRTTGAATNTGSQVTVDNGAGGDEVVAANSSRKGLFLHFSGDVYVSFGGVPDSSSFLLYAGQPINFPLPSGFVYTGAITALAPTASAVTAYRAEF